ncbi:HET-domain-containing protein [Polychaeton citri CBS 116435]|uniref:HET-domain-containing protein n=1 Tax=Polychaeton citri CBS 116435 TaxID=1314669 RepID=A0A9P4UMX2_9PEZI|nr:HET-domain-containing protein [Polychaeton citri CBS 116435]
MNFTRYIPRRDSRENTLEYHYGLLKGKTSIRLAQIRPGSGHKGLAIDLIDAYVTGANRLSYDALSYVWADANGEIRRDKNISCNGKSLPITETLLEALRRFRDPDHVVTLWIDQICICQDRHLERSEQVKMMGEIFRGANKVVVWLGKDYDDSQAGMQLVSQLVKIADQRRNLKRIGNTDLELHGLPSSGHKRWKALSEILKRPWFWRTWIVQEVVLNPNVHLVLGPNMVTWDELERIIYLLEGPAPSSWQVDQAVTASELPFSRINRIRLRHQHRLLSPLTPTIQQLALERSFSNEPESYEREDIANETADGESDPELLDLLLMSRDLGASDPRDKIYALLGIAKHDVDVDYTASPKTVFMDFALSTMGSVIEMAQERATQGLDTLTRDRDVRRAFLLLACAGRHNQDPKLDLPSWVPDWTTSLQSRPLMFGIHGKRFSAGGSLLSTFDWQHDTGLMLCGKLFDTVGAAGRHRLQHDSLEHGEDPHKMIRDWWQEACQIAALCRDLAVCKHGYYTGEARNRRRGSLLDDSELTQQDAVHSASQTLTLGPTRGRVLFVSGSGFVGLAPHGTLEGDLIFVVVGIDVPLVLRPFEEAYELIGEVYVQGIMDGEALAMEQLLVQDVMIR